MIIAYYGADGVIESSDNEFTIVRRNMAILLSLAKSRNVSLVINCIRVSRKSIFKKKNFYVHNKIYNFHFAPIFPERGPLIKIGRPLNNFIFRVSNYKILKLLRQESTLNWCYWPNGYIDYNYFAPRGKMVFDTDHNILTSQFTNESHLVNRQELLVEIGERAQYILSSSRSMLKWYKANCSAELILLMNGQFEERRNIYNKGNNKIPQITYCGTLSKWIKTEWLINLIKKYKTWHFNIIGQNYQTSIHEKLQNYDNVTLHGFRSPKDVDLILENTDVALGLYKESEYLDVNSMKLYDYLNKGTVTVVNRFHNNLDADFSELLTIASSYKEYEKSILIGFNKGFEEKRLLNFLENSTWDKRIEQVLEHIDDKYAS